MHVVLVATASPTPIRDGYTLRVSGFARNLARVPGVARVSLVCPAGRNEQAALEKWAGEHDVKILPIEPLEISPMERFDGARLRASVDAALALLVPPHENVVVVVMGPLASIHLAGARSDFPRAADLMDEESPHKLAGILEHLRGFRVIRSVRELKWYFDYMREIRSLSEYAAVIVSAYDDADRLFRRGISRVLVVGNGVTLPAESQTSGRGEAEEGASARGTAEAPSLVFHGNFDFPPNEEAALLLIEQIFPPVAKAVPGCTLKLVGRNASARLAESARRTAGVVLTGEVPEISSHLRSATLGVYPIHRRTGLQSKILEAWAHGVCIVTTPAIVSAFVRFDAEARACAVAADTPEEFAREIEMLLSNRARAREVARLGRRLAESRFGWPAMARQFADVCRSALQAAKP